VHVGPFLLGMTCSSFGALMLCWGIANMNSGAELPGQRRLERVF